VNELLPEIPDCSTTVLQLPAFLRGELDALHAGLIEGHLYTCDQCAEAFGLTVAQARASGAALERTVPKTAPARRAISSFSWHTHRSTGREVVRPALLRSVALASRQRGQRLGAGAARTAAIQLIDSAWDPLGIEVSAAVTSPPLLEANGDFRLSLALSPADAARCLGGSLVCLLRLDGGACIRFESVVDGAEIGVHAEGLPTAGETVPIPLNWLEFFLIPAAPPAAL
jgi:hypothetical protein